LVLDAEVYGEATSVASLVVRGNPSAMAGYLIGLDFARQTVSFCLRFPGKEDSVLQERKVALSPEAWHKLKVVVQWKFFEVYVDDVLLLVHDQRIYEDGCFGLQARGTVKFRHVQAYTVDDAQVQTRDWQSRCQPRHLFPSLR